MSKKKKKTSLVKCKKKKKDVLKYLGLARKKLLNSLSIIPVLVKQRMRKLLTLLADF